MRKAKAVEVSPDTRLALVLPQTSFADAYRVTGPAPGLDARRAALAIFANSPAWTTLLMALRNSIVRPFGLKTPKPPTAADNGTGIGIFPLLRESAQEVLLGLDDRHLDFRIVVTVVPADAGNQAVTVTSLIRTHNLLGRSYLRMVLPFHRLIVCQLLQRAAASWGAAA